MTKFIGAVLIAIALFIYLHPRSDAYIRDRVVKLSSDRGMCSGEQIRTPSGKDYVLSAAHCKHLAKNGFMTATGADGNIYQLRVIGEDEASDLLLIEGIPNLKGLQIADEVYTSEEVKTFTHGHNMPTYETTGELLGDREVQVPIFEIGTAEEALECANMTKYRVYSDPFSGNICVLSVQETLTTAKIIPGSSGGPVLNASGELVGVVSAGDGDFGALVRLIDIKHFLRPF